MGAYFASLNLLPVCPQETCPPPSRRAFFGVLMALGVLHHLPAAGRGRSEQWTAPLRLGGAVTVMLIIAGLARMGWRCSRPLLAGVLAGLCTGLLHIKTRHPRHPCRYPDAVRALFHKPAHHGHEGKPDGKPQDVRHVLGKRRQGFPRLFALCRRRRSASSFVLAVGADVRCSTGISAPSRAPRCARPAPTPR